MTRTPDPGRAVESGPPGAAEDPVQARLSVDGLALERGTLRLVDNLSFTVAARALVHLRGPNGSGKTTVLRALAGLVTPAAGTVSWNGVAIAASPDYCRSLNFVAHSAGLSAELSARENLEFLNAFAGQAPRCTIDAALGALGADRFADRPVRQLSAGQRQRVTLARLLLFKRPLWMLDEPLTALDAATRELLEAIIDEHVEGGGMVIIATHQSFTTRHPQQLIDLAAARA